MSCTHEHECPDWDYMLIGPGYVELGCCTCKCTDEPDKEGVRTLELLYELNSLQDSLWGHSKPDEVKPLIDELNAIRARRK